MEIQLHSFWEGGGRQHGGETVLPVCREMLLLPGFLQHIRKPRVMGQGGEEVWREECALETFLCIFRHWRVRRASEVCPLWVLPLPCLWTSHSCSLWHLPGSHGVMERTQAWRRAELTWDLGDCTFSHDTECISCLKFSILIHKTGITMLCRAAEGMSYWAFQNRCPVTITGLVWLCVCRCPVIAGGPLAGA